MSESEIPFNIKFVIFDENKPLTQKQIKIRNKLIDMNNIDNDMKKILKNSISNLSEYKFLNRLEPSIATIDEQKQLRMMLGYIVNNQYSHSVHFSQKHSQCKKYFSIEELKNISNNLKKELEEYLHYEIDTPILYINIDDV